MTLQSNKPETIPFKDEEGNEVEDATFTIRGLSHAAAEEYRRMGAEGDGFEELVVARQRLGDDDDLEKIPAEVTAHYGVGLTRSGAQARIRDYLLEHALVRVDGVLDEDGHPVTKETIREQEDWIVRQVVVAIQRRVARSADPNGRRRSATS